MSFAAKKKQLNAYTATIEHDNQQFEGLLNTVSN